MQFGASIPHRLKEWRGIVAGVALVVAMVTVLGWIGSIILEREYDAQIDGCIDRYIRAGETLANVLSRCNDQLRG